MQQAEEKDSYSTHLFEIMVGAVDESITDEKSWRQLRAQHKRNLWLLRVALRDGPRKGRGRVKERNWWMRRDDEYFFDRDDIEEMKEKLECI